MSRRSMNSASLPGGRRKTSPLAGSSWMHCQRDNGFAPAKRCWKLPRNANPGHQMDAIWQGLQEALRGRRGILCRVIESGQIRRGDAIEIVQGENATRVAPAFKWASE